MKTGAASSSARSKVISEILRAALSFVLYFGLFSAFFKVAIYHGENMKPALADGDLVVLYRYGSLSTGDIAAYDHDGKVCFGRIAAMGGEQIEQTDGLWRIAEQSSLKHEDTEIRDRVGKDQYFVLSDYPAGEDDSSLYGCIGKKDIIGTVMLLLRRRSF